MSLISFYDMTCSIPLELPHSIEMLIYIYIYIYECVQVNITCAFRGVIASVGVSLLGMAHPLWKTFQVQGIHLWKTLIWGREVEESRLVAGVVLFVKTLERTSFGICLCM